MYKYHPIGLYFTNMCLYRLIMACRFTVVTSLALAVVGISFWWA